LGPLQLDYFKRFILSITG